MGFSKVKGLGEELAQGFIGLVVHRRGGEGNFEFTVMDTGKSIA